MLLHGRDTPIKYLKIFIAMLYDGENILRYFLLLLNVKIGVSRQSKTMYIFKTAVFLVQ